MIGTVISCAAASLAFGLWLGQRIHRREWAKVADAIDAVERMEAELDGLQGDRDYLLYLLDNAKRRLSLPRDLLRAIDRAKRMVEGGES